MRDFAPRGPAPLHFLRPHLPSHISFGIRWFSAFMFTDWVLLVTGDVNST